MLINEMPDTGFNSIIQLYVVNYIENQDAWYDEYKDRLSRDDESNWKSNWDYDFNTCLVTEGDLPCLVIKKNGDLIKLHPFFYTSEESVNFDSNFVLTLGMVAGNLVTVGYIEGVDDYNYPVYDQDNVFGFLGEWEPYMRISIDLHEGCFAAFQDDFDDLDITNEEYYKLGRQLLLSCLETAMDIMGVAEDSAIDFNDYKMSDLSDYGWAEILSLTPSSDDFKYIAQQNSDRMVDILSAVKQDREEQ
jgi:hypothetical protein